MLTFVTFRAQLLAVWQSGAFFDTDDAMRLVQVRALLEGQGWYDMTAKAMNPPHGVFLHWSRVVDVPIAALIKGLGLVTDPTSAERMTRLVFPFSLLVGLYLGIARVGGLLLGPVARIPAIAATLLSGNGIAQFVPGRIDHHAPQIVILVWMVGSALACLDPRHARHAAVVGLLAALSLSISLEDMPFIVCVGACLVGLWVWHGAPMNRMLGWFAAALATGLLVVFVATIGPARYVLPVCDAYGAAHCGVGLIGAAGIGLAAFAAPRSRSTRLVAAMAVAGACAMFLVVFYPACLRSPFAGLDPLVREIWMANVEEALPLSELFRQDATMAWTSLLPVVLGLAGCGLAAWRSRDLQRTRFAILSTVVAAGLAMAFWQVRVFTSMTALAVCGGLYVAVSARRWCLDRGRPELASFAWLLLFPFTATAVSLAMTPPAAHARTADAEPGLAACLAPAALAPLADLGSGTVLAPLDLGSFLLAHTRFDVFAASYHRNNDGNRFALETMLAPSDEAGRRAASRKTTYLIVCPASGETRRLAARNPGSLAAALLAGRVPDWLTRMPLTGTPLQIFKLRPAT